MRDTNDLVTKDFESYPDVAADIINALMCDGEKSVREGHLVSAPTESIYQGSESLRNQLADVVKYEVYDGKIQAMYLFANQTRSDRRMLLRKAGYVSAAYREQYDGKTRDVYPVMEVVLYWGKARWKGHRRLHGMFSGKRISKAAWRYIDDMELHVFEMRRLPMKVRKRFTGGMRIVVDFLAEGTNYRSNRKVVHKAALVRMIRVLSGDTDVADTEAVLAQMNIKEEDEITVCELFDQYTRKGIAQGITQGIRVLIDCCKSDGLSYEETAARIGNGFHLQPDQVREHMKMYW